MSSLDFQRRKIEPGFKGKAGFDAGLSCFSTQSTKGVLVSANCKVHKK